MNKKASQYALVAGEAYKYILDNNMDPAMAWDKAAEKFIQSLENNY